MRYATIATGIVGVVAGLLLSAPSLAQKAEAPIPQRPRIEMPVPAATEGQGSTEPAERTSVHRQPHVRPSRPAVTVNRAEANAFTAELNRRELESLGAGASLRPAAHYPNR